NNNTQEIFVQFQNNKTFKQDILYPTTEDFLIVLNQSSSYQQQQQRSIINNLNNDLIPFSIDNRLY
ncbi:unnamed protein product, partial [Rotaria sp. Silwood1]